MRFFLKNILPVFFLTTAVHSQTVNILFDASKAETAGSADWVIDTDLHNIGYSNGPAVVGQGNESNAQQLPTPAQSGVTSATAETYWQGALSGWGIDCVKKGYHVESLPYNGQITYGNTGNVQDLSHYKVFIVCEPNIIFTASEKTALMNFIQNGGGLFMVSDHTVSDRNNDGWDSPAIWNDFITNNSVQNNAFGISVDLQNFSETTTNIPNLPIDSLLHGPMGNVTQAMWSNGTSFTLNPAQNSTVKGVLYRTGSKFGKDSVMCAYARYGSGKVAVIGDSSPCDDGTGDPNDVLYNGYYTDAAGNHEKLLMNITIWLATPNGATGVSNLDEENSGVIIFPNPSDGKFTIQSRWLSGSQFTIQCAELYNLLGVKIWTMSPSGGGAGGGLSIDVSNYPDGVYFLQTESGGKHLTKKIVIQH
jgi:hypothetical protein